MLPYPKTKDQKYWYGSVTLAVFFLLWDLFPVFSDEPDSLEWKYLSFLFFFYLSVGWLAYLWKREKKMRVVAKFALPFMIMGVYFTPIVQGRKLVRFSDCDMSVCTAFTIKSNGSYRLSRNYVQCVTEYEQGRVKIEGDTLYLIKGFYINLNYFRLSKADINGKYVILMEHPGGGWLPVDRIVK